MEKSHTCPFCKKIIPAPELARNTPLFSALEEEIKDFAPEDADVLCQESSEATLPDVEYQIKCPGCGKNVLVMVSGIDFKCASSADSRNLVKINEYKTYRVSKIENRNLQETRGLREFLKTSEAAQAQFFFKVTHTNHVHPFCSRCGGPVMITFHGLDTAQESFEFTCRQCGKHGNYKREPVDFEDKPLIESTRKNP